MVVELPGKQAWVLGDGIFHASSLAHPPIFDSDITVGSVRENETFFLTRSGCGLKELQSSSWKLSEGELTDDAGECIGDEDLVEEQESLAEIIGDRQLVDDVSEAEEANRW